MPRKKYSILVRMPNWLGDCVMATPAVTHLAECLPDADIYLAAREQFRPLLAGQPGVKGFFPAPGSGIGKMYRCIVDKSVLRGFDNGGRFDAGVLLTNSLSTAFWLWWVGADMRIGYRTDGRRLFLTHPVPCGGVEKSWHFVRYYLWLAKFTENALCETEGINHRQLDSLEKYLTPHISVNAEAREKARNLLALKGVVGEYAVLAPASAYGEVKDWPAAHYRELIKKLNKEFSLPVVVTGAGGQKAVCDAIAADQANAVSVAGETDMAEFAGLIAESVVFVGGDSGGAHVAGALGIPTIVIFGITNPSRTRPQGEKVVMMGAGEDKDVRLSTPEAKEAAKKALAAIAPERVLDAVRRVCWRE